MSAVVAAPYRPRTDLAARLRRRSARVMATDTVRPRLSRGLVSLSFDDCPVSVRDNALPLLEARGWRGTVYACLGLVGHCNHLGEHMSGRDYRTAFEAGHEIGDHTYSHLDGLAQGPGRVLRDAERNTDALAALGIPAPKTFAYPYGEVTPALKRALRGRYRLLRGIHSPRGGTVDLALAASQRLYSAHMDAVERALEHCAAQRTWLILFTHDVRDAPSEFGCTPDEFAAVLERIARLGLDVATVAQGAERAA